MHYSEIDPKSAFMTASQFDMASIVLKNHPRLTQEKFFISIWVNEAFATEVYLKCIYALENSNQCPKVHDLKKNIFFIKC